MGVIPICQHCAIVSIGGKLDVVSGLIFMSEKPSWCIPLGGAIFCVTKSTKCIADKTVVNCSNSVLGQLVLAISSPVYCSLWV